MPVSVTMPALGESVTEGTVTRWLKQEGDRVETDEPLLEVSTDKVDTEIPSPAAGVLQRIVVAEDETVEVGAELAVIGDGADGGEAPAEQSAPAAEQPAEPAQQQESWLSQPAPAQPGGSLPPAPQLPPAPEPPASTPAPAEQAAPAAESSGGGEQTTLTMPALGESVTEGTVTRWLKNVGDSVSADEPLLEVSTDKVDTEIPSPAAGTLLEIKVAEDETVEVGAPLAVIGAAGAAPAAAPAEPPAPAAQEASAPEPAPEPAPAPAAAAPAPAPTATVPAAPTTPPPASNGDGGAYVTPLVRKLATENDVDLSAVTGTGVGGRIRKQDVLAAAESAKAAKAAPAPVQAAPAPVTTASAPTAAPPARPAAVPAAAAELRGKTSKLPRLRKLIAQRMVESLQTQAQLTTVVEVDVTRIAKLRQQVKADFEAREGVKLSFLPFFALAAVEALKAHPMVNSSVDLEAGTVTYHDSENLGIAVDTERGLLTPVIHNAGDLNLAGIARKIADLADRTRNNKVLPDELAGATFTLTNTGSRGALFDTPIVPLPQSGILGTGAVVKRPVVVNDDELGEIITVRSMIYLALSYDHRIVDGADAARFLSAMKERLEAGHFEAEVGL